MLINKHQTSEKGRARLRNALCGVGTLSLLALPVTASANSDLFCTVDGPVFADYKIQIKKNSSIVGMNGGMTHVLSNHKLYMSHNALIDGHVTAEKIKMKDKEDRASVITGDVVEMSAGIVPADATDVVAAFEHLNDNHHIPLTNLGDTALDKLKLEVRKGDHLVLPAGDYFLKSLKVKKGAVLELAGAVSIYMEKGKIDLKYGSIVGAADAGLSIVIAEKGHLKVGAHSGFHAAVYAPESKFDLKGEGVASGSLIVDKIKIDKGAEFRAMDACAAGPPELETDPNLPPLFDYWLEDEGGDWMGTDGRAYDDQGQWLD